MITEVMLVFQAAGVTYLHNIASETTAKIPILDEEASYFSPSFIHSAEFRNSRSMD